MTEIYGSTVGEVWIKYLQNVIENGDYYHDEGEHILELSDIVLTVENDEENDWILQKYGDQHLKELYLKKMQTKEIVKELNASYVHCFG